MIDWAEEIHSEVRSLRVMAQVVFVLWLLGVILGVIGLVLAAD